MNQCKCDEMSCSFFFEETPWDFFSKLEKVSNWGLLEIFKCENCGQHWAFDENEEKMERIPKWHIARPICNRSSYFVVYQKGVCL